MEEIVKESYSVLNKQNGYKAISNFIKNNNHSKVLILTDENTLKNCLKVFKDQVQFEKEPTVLTIKSGEEFKNIDTCSYVWDKLSELGADRKSLLINLGGGVVTDLGGFVASTYKRGIDFINIPTSLLAMVDASVGGKNGVDLGSLKNQIGIIKQPKIVVIDLAYLKTLPKEEERSGYAEILKHGLINSKAYWNTSLSYLGATEKIKAEIIWKSIYIKEAIVSEDPYEASIRKTLNYGHTLGHAIESYFLTHPNRKRLLHGEAIAIGMVLATFISSEMLNFSKDDLKSIAAFLVKIYGKVDFNQEDISKIIELLIHDKKNTYGKINFVLLNDFGSFEIDKKVPNNLIYKSFDYYKNL